MRVLIEERHDYCSGHFCQQNMALEMRCYGLNASGHACKSVANDIQDIGRDSSTYVVHERLITAREELAGEERTRILLLASDHDEAGYGSLEVLAHFM